MLEKDLLTKVPNSEVNAVITMLNELPQDDPDPKIINKRFYLFMKLGQYEKAQQNINLLIKDLPLTHPKRSWVLHCKAIMLSCLGDMNGAMETIDESLQANQDYAAGLAGRGMLRAKIGDLNGAIEDLTRSVELEPQNIEAFDEKAKVERSLGNE